MFGLDLKCFIYQYRVYYATITVLAKIIFDFCILKKGSVYVEKSFAADHYPGPCRRGRSDGLSQQYRLEPSQGQDFPAVLGGHR